MAKLSIAIHKLTSCSGCQLAFLNQGETLLTIATIASIKHFIEGGIFNPKALVDVAFVEGSVTTDEDLERLKMARANSKWLISIGACATSGGIQALKNLHDSKQWQQDLYPNSGFVTSLPTSTGIAEHITVDAELWGCPVSTAQMQQCLARLRSGVLPKPNQEKLCMECKRQNLVCVMVTQDKPCLGPVTRSGCGALCPSLGRGCYGCYGPSEQPNTQSLSAQFKHQGLDAIEIQQQFSAIHSHHPANKQETLRWQPIEGKAGSNDT